MKNSLFLPFRRVVTLLALILLAACSKKDETTPTPGISWTVDGSDIKVGAIATPVSATIIQLTGYRSVTTSTSTSNTATISLIMPKSIGTYTLSNNKGAASASYGDSGTLYLDTTGTITVSSLTATSITGTFSFSGANPFSTPNSTKSITNGQFNVLL